MLFFGVIFLYVREFTFINNTMRLADFLLIGFMTSFVFASLFILIKHKIVSSLFEKFVFSIGVIVIFFMLTPLLLSLLNRMFGENQSTPTAYKLLSTSNRSQQMYGVLDSATLTLDGMRVRVATDQGEESFYLKDMSSFWIDQDSIYLQMRLGVFGYQYVYQ